jgi:cation diffusion facilitator CzcD-associated flavoprotein CzcO
MGGTTGKIGLDGLAARVQRELSLLDYPRREWLAPRQTRDGAPILDVVVIGGGQSGLATAFGLWRERVRNVRVLDENPLDRAGPWLSFARMHTLRTPKYLTGPDLGVPSLTPRAFYEAQHGDGSWETLGLLPKETWAAYLRWYRETLQLPVVPETRAGTLTWDAAARAFTVPCTNATTGARLPDLHARRVVLATGIDGSGHWEVPAMIESALPRRLYAHTRWDIDFGALAGKRIAVLGAGASAFDNAAMALEHGAREVRLFFRRPTLVNVNAYRWAEFVGFLRHVGDLPDPERWRFIQQIVRMGQLPPADTYARARRHAHFHLHPNTRWRALRAEADDSILIEVEAGGTVSTLPTDFVIVGTGFVTDLARRPELAAVEPFIARWSDRYTPPPDEANADLGRHPYLGPSFEMTERTPGEAPWLRHLFNYTFGSLPSLGFGGASISGMKYSLPRLIAGITGSLFREDQAAHFESLRNYSETEF